MKTHVIRFWETDVDGCGSNAEVMIQVRADEKFTNETKQKLIDTIDDIKKEWKEWDTDSIVQEACKRVFGSEFTGWYPEIDIEF